MCSLCFLYASQDYRKKAAKFLAAKCTLAARVDSCHEYPSGELGESQLARCIAINQNYICIIFWVIF